MFASMHRIAPLWSCLITVEAHNHIHAQCPRNIVFRF